MLRFAAHFHDFDAFILETGIALKVELESPLDNWYQFLDSLTKCYHCLKYSRTSIYFLRCLLRRNEVGDWDFYVGKQYPTQFLWVSKFRIFRTFTNYQVLDANCWFFLTSEIGQWFNVRYKFKVEYSTVMIACWHVTTSISNVFH